MPPSYPAEAGGERGSEDFPQVFGKYVLLRPMARGGMGELFLAAAGETGGFEKLCVVKKVLHDLIDDGVRRRFLDEAKVVVRLNHANLVQVFDAGRVATEHYLAMELVEGKDLRAVWNRCAQLHRRIPVDFAICATRELCRGLDYVHDAMGLDLVHRDISPPNILVSYHGQVKITDFGLAKHAIKRELTNPGVVFGRYSYLSPEQARGLPADRRTDIYAAGIILWEMLTGRQLFPTDRGGQGSQLSVLRNPKIRAPSDLVPGVPEGLDEVVLRALAVEREDRYDSAGTFREDLSKVLARNFPSAGVDSVATFMREIFSREYKLESQDYAGFSREDFSLIRQQGEVSETISIEELAEPSSAIQLGDSDIVELDSGNRARGWVETPPPTETLEEEAADRVGRSVDKRYRIEELIGIGGMGAVYSAKHLALGKTYALKVLHEVYGRDPDIIDRFMREARAATQTGHPNIIDVIDIGTMDDGNVYFVMELLDGTDIGTVVAQSGAVSFRRAVHIGRQICKALGAAHTAGIIHRDLKSENVVLVTRGKDPDFVKVLDFGICKQVDTASSAQTTPGMVMGSPDYMAPEQAAGAAANAKSDIYALGTILFEMLTGGLPFQGRNAIDVLMKKGGRPAPDVRAARPETPPELADLVARCLSRDLEERPDSMKQLEYELTRAVEGRATAVAEAMGLKLEAGPSAGDSGVEDLGRASTLAPGVTEGPPKPGEESAPTTVYTVHDQAAASSAAMSQPSMSQSAAVSQIREAPRGGALGGAAKALLFVILGGALAGALALAFAPDKLGLDDGAAVVGDGMTAPEPQVPAPAPTPTPAVPMPAPDEVQPGPDVEPEETKEDPTQIVTRAEEALAAERFREPAAGSLAVELVNLSLVDPGNEALPRLRKEAEKILRPRAEKALKRKRWTDAADAYRDLFTVWPEYSEGRSDFAKALANQGRVQKKSGDHEAALATADEMLVLDAEDFRGLRLRADALAGLERWEDAVPAYRKALRAKPKHADTRKRYRLARRKLAKLKKTESG